MGLFKRSAPEDDRNDDFNDIELPTSSDLGGSELSPAEPELGISTERNYKPKTGYSIEDAIELMRGLPRDNNEVVVTVVKKTLESTEIKVGDIIDDAASREKRLRARHKKLEEEIKQLQDKITLRNQQIQDLLGDLKETTDVRQRLELALKLDAGKTEKAEDARDNKPAGSSPGSSSPASTGTTTNATTGTNTSTTATAGNKPANTGNRPNGTRSTVGQTRPVAGPGSTGKRP